MFFSSSRAWQSSRIARRSRPRCSIRASVAHRWWSNIARSTSEGPVIAGRTIAPPAGGVPLDKIKTLPVDYDYIEKEAARLKKRFNEIFQ